MTNWTPVLSPAFAWCLRTTLEASCLAVLVLALQAALGKRLSARWRYLLWLIVIVRMLMPWAPESSLSLFNYVPRVETAAASQAPVVVVAPPIMRAPGFETAASQALRAPEPMPWGEFAWTTLAALWFAGALVVALHILTVNLLFARKLRVKRPLREGPAAGLLEECRRTLGLKRRVDLAETKAVGSPAVFGLVRPVVLLPPGLAEALPPNQLRYVLLHELAHVKRRDIAVNWVLAALQALHWFNPLIWFAFHRLRIDRELACDALALDHLGDGENRAYGHTIVDLLEHVYQTRRIPGMAGVLEEHNQLKRRLTMITLFQKRTYRWSFIGALALAALGCAGLTNAMEEDREEAAPKEAAGAAQQKPAPQAAKTTTETAKRIVDKIDYPFVDDPRLIGSWETVDFVDDPADFKPGGRQTKNDLYLKSMSCGPNGQTDGPWRWTKGLIIHPGDKTAAAYNIETLDGADYLFFEWKSGDVTMRGMKPKYYVLKKVSDEAPVPSYAPEHDPAFREEFTQHWQDTDLFTLTPEEIAGVLGQPAALVWNRLAFKDFDEAAEQPNYIMCYPDHIDLWVQNGALREARFYNPGYRFARGVDVGDSPEKMIEVMGEPEASVQGKMNTFKDGLYFMDIVGRAGDGYYQRNDKGVRCFLRDGAVHAVYVYPPHGIPEVAQLVPELVARYKQITSRDLTDRQRIEFVTLWNAVRPMPEGEPARAKRLSREEIEKRLEDPVWYFDFGSPNEPAPSTPEEHWYRLTAFFDMVSMFTDTKIPISIDRELWADPPAIYHFKVEKVTVRQALDALLKPLNLAWSIEDGYVLIHKPRLETSELDEQFDG